jgi:hypothetical protein
MSSDPSGTTERDPDPAWYRALNLSVPVNPKFEPFAITATKSEQGNHVVGEFDYFNYKADDKSPPPVTIKGSKKSDGTFWPVVSAEVGDNPTGPWTTIGRPPTPERPASLSITTKPKEERFYVNMDLFLPLIGKVKFGRVVLETGEAAVFGLEVLVPPKTDPQPHPDASSK